MYIFERIISIGIFLIITFSASIFISKQDNYKNIKTILIIYVICLCVLSYFYIPADTADLTRLRIFITNTYSKMSFSDYINMLKETSTFTTHTFYYLITKIGIKELLSVVSCLINYSTLTYILYDYSKKRNISSSSISNAFLLYMITGQFLEVISDIRSMCAFSIFFLCIYREFFQNKKVLSNVLLYIIAIGFHNAVVPIVFIRFVYLLFQKEEKIINKMLNYLMFILILFFTYKYGSVILDATFVKANNYLSDNIYSYFWTFLSSTLTIILVVHVCIKNKKVINETISKKYRILFFLILLLDIISGFIITEYTMFRRYSRVVVMLFLPIVMQCFNYKTKTERFHVRKNDILYYLLIYSILFIEISRGDLCGIRYFTF